MKFFGLQGRPVKKVFQYANLNFATLMKSISITEIHFMTDLSAVDKHFQMWIADVSTENKNDLFYDDVRFTKEGGGFRRYVLPRPCAIPADSKIWITFAFDRPDNRYSYDNVHVDMSSSLDLVNLRNDTGKASSAQIVSHFLFKEN